MSKYLTYAYYQYTCTHAKQKDSTPVDGRQANTSGVGERHDQIRDVVRDVARGDEP